MADTPTPPPTLLTLGIPNTKSRWADRFAGDWCIPLNDQQIKTLNRIMPKIPIRGGKRDALGALLRGEWELGVAAAAGVDEDTVRHWRATDADFQQAMNMLMAWVKAHFDRLYIQAAHDPKVTGRHRVVRDRLFDMDPNRKKPSLEKPDPDAFGPQQLAELMKGANLAND